MINACVIAGRLGRKPELKQTRDGKSVLSFSIACERDFKSLDGNRATDWIPVVCFGQTAEYIHRYADKGRLLCVIGRLQIRDWVDDGGAKRTFSEIVAEKVQFLDTPKREDRQGGRPEDRRYSGGGTYQGYGYPPMGVQV